jgi:23S rRNA G2069 N7-methylase RlmK/C1962 C5-methylase RlmI
VSQKWRTKGALRCRRHYRKRQKNVKKILLDLFADLAVFESGTKQINYFKIQGVPELADQIETVYSLMVMKLKNV